MEHGEPYFTGGCGHVHLCCRVFILQHRQGADVVQVGVGHKNGIGVCAAYEAELRGRIGTIFFRVHAGIQNDAYTVHVEHVAIRADIGVAGKIREAYHQKFEVWVRLHHFVCFVNDERRGFICVGVR